MSSPDTVPTVPQEELSSEEIAKQLIQEGIQHYRSTEEGSYEKARLSFESARDVAKAGGCELQEARALGNLANAYSSLDENIQASDLYRLSIFLFKKLGESAKEAIILKNAANVEKELKNWDEAIRLLRRRIAICEDLGQEDNRQDSIRLIKVCQLSYEKEKQEAEKAALKQQIEKCRSKRDHHRDALDLKTCNNIIEELTEIKSKCVPKQYKVLEGLAHLELARTHLVLDTIDQHSKNKQHMRSTFITEMDNALKQFESLRAVGAVRAYLMEGLDELAAFYIRHEQNKEAVKVLERKARCFDARVPAERSEMEEVINRINKMRADLHAVKLGEPGVLSTALNPSEKLPISIAEERLRRAELSARQHREMMQLTFKDIPIPQIEKRVLNAEASMGQLSPFVKSSGQAELSCAKAIKDSMSKNTFSWTGAEKASFRETGTLQVALEALKGHMMRTSNLKKRFAEEVMTDVVRPIETSTKGVSSFLKVQTGHRRNQESQVQAAVDKIAEIKNKIINLETSANKLKKQVDNLSIQERSSITNPIVTRQRRKNQELSDMGDLLQITTMEFERCKKQAFDVKERLADEYQRHELRRVSILRERLLQFVEIEEEHLKARENILKRLKYAVNAVDPTSDLRLFTHDQKVRSLCHGEWKHFNEDYASGIGNLTDDEGEKDKRALGVIASRLFASATETVDEKILSREQIAEMVMLLEQEVNRKRLIRLMNLQRSKRQDIGPGFATVVKVVNSFLDKCVEQNDVKGGKMMMIMSETFFRFKHLPDSDQTDNGAGPKSRENRREYLQESIKHHRIWQNLHFWEEAFFLSVREEVVKHLKQVQEGSVSKETNFGEFYRNILFGQLGSYALNMLNFGVALDVTLSFIRKLCIVNRIGEEKRKMLIENAKMIKS